MAREDHQPVEATPERPERTPDEMRAVCGRAIAIILALDKNADGSDPDIPAAIAAARKARVAAALVFAAPSFAFAAQEAVRTAGKKGSTFVQPLEYDPAAAIPLTREAGDFELFNLPYGLLVTARAVAESLLDDYEAVLIMDAAQNHITADHLYELCFDAHEVPEAEAVASQIQGLQCTPCWFSHAFLDRLENRDASLIGAEKADQASAIAMRDHVFGEE